MLYSGVLDWTSSIRPIVRVESNESLDKVFARMQPNQEVLAAVVKGLDVVGILTMEDLMEHIVSRLTVPRTEEKK
jgi:CBS domain containing-hemolysin-like protein